MDQVGKHCQRGYDLAMRTRNISLTAPLDAFIDGRVASGRYQNASEVVRASLRLLERDERENAVRDRLLAAIAVGEVELDAGLGITVRREALPAYITELGRSGRSSD